MLRAGVITLGVLLAPLGARADAADEVLAAVNAARAEAGCPALSIDRKLSAAARAHATAMAEEGFFSHTGADGSGMDDRIAAQGYAFSRAAENIAAGQSSVAAVMKSWLGSSGRRRNILDCALRQTGIAMIHQPDDEPLSGKRSALRYYWVQVFASP
jgi:uncharacterized protein YkwD